MSITDLIPGVAEIKTGIAVAIVVAMLGGAGYLAWELHELKKVRVENTQLAANIKQLQANAATQTTNMDECVAVNTGNQATIQSLLKERSDAQKAVTNLANEAKSDSMTIKTLQDKLQVLKENITNDGPLAPDLRETIRGIEGAK